MKFDFIIGNPPYQEEVENNGRANPIYNLFMDATYEISDRVLLITPARFLFNAGQTPKAWNRKMLTDRHFTVIKYEQNSKNVFPSAELTGGVCISYRDTSRDFGAIEEYTQYKELNSALIKIKSLHEDSFANLIVGAVPYRFSTVLAQEHPELTTVIGNSYDLRTNVLDKLYNILFFDVKPEDGFEYIKIIGLLDGKRKVLYVRKDYIIDSSDILFKYNLLISESNGAAGTIGKPIPARIIGESVVAEPGVGQTQTFISIGAFTNIDETKFAGKYLRTKFLRSLLGIRKVTQHNPQETWRLIPLQDFTSSSDIDWTKSIPEIDRQLYAKYGLDESEIEFIETHVKEMS